MIRSLPSVCGRSCIVSARVQNGVLARTPRYCLYSACPPREDTGTRSLVSTPASCFGSVRVLLMQQNSQQTLLLQLWISTTARDQCEHIRWQEATAAISAAVSGSDGTSLPESSLEAQLGAGSESPRCCSLAGCSLAAVAAAGLAGQLAERCKPAALQTFVTIIGDLRGQGSCQLSVISLRTIPSP